MARRARSVPIPWSEPPPDTRPRGTVRFADAPTSILNERVSTFNDPHSPGLKGTSEGVRPVENDDVRRRWGYNGAEGVEIMNRKRGVAGDEEE